jgi:FKBP-type peptidyl-prolyl cis-trans isomerase FkpA
MRKLMIIVFVALLAIPACSSSPKTEDQKTFYELGAMQGKQMSVFDLSSDELKYVQQGMADQVAGKKLETEPNQATMQKLQLLAQARMLRTAEKQKELSKPFLEKAAAEKGAQKTASGLIYTEIKPGTGAQPKPSNFIKFHYVGTLIDGKEFDSSVKRGQPVEFPLSQMIPCWQEGITMMKAGGKAKLVCPSNLAYGDRGAPPVIPGGATLIFEVELLDAQSSGATAPKLPQAPKAAKKK